VGHGGRGEGGGGFERVKFLPQGCHPRAGEETMFNCLVNRGGVDGAEGAESHLGEPMANHNSFVES
jgi:hypothetical protein